jgi:hypothetical protein
MRGGGTCGLGGSSSRYAPLPTGSPSRYLLHPCITRLPTAHAAITPFCTHAPPFSHFLGRMVWGSGALGDSGAPPHAPCAFPLSLQPGRWLGLHAAGAVCSLSPVHHWAASGFIIRCRWLQLVGVALVDHIEASAVGPAPITSRPTVTNCDDLAPTASTCHGWKRSDGMLSATAAMQPSPDRSCSRWQARHRHPVPHHPTDL